MSIELNNWIAWVRCWMNNRIEWIFETKYWIEKILGSIQRLVESSKSIKRPYRHFPHIVFVYSDIVQNFCQLSNFSMYYSYLLNRNKFRSEVWRSVIKKRELPVESQPQVLSNLTLFQTLVVGCRRSHVAEDQSSDHVSRSKILWKYAITIIKGNSGKRMLCR